MISRLVRASVAGVAAGVNAFVNDLCPVQVSGYTPEEAPGRWGDVLDAGEMVPDVPIFSGGTDHADWCRECHGPADGGFCDGPLLPGGVYHHCEGAMGFAQCFYVRPVPVEVDPRGWVPA